MKSFCTLLLLGLITVHLSAAQDQAAVDTTAAIHDAGEAALAWLHIIDDEQYSESWENASALFQSAVTAAAWSDALTQARGPFEPFGERTPAPASSTYTTDVPSAPGEWVILQYRTKTASNDVIETVSMMKEADGVWRAGGYYVAPQ